MKVRVVVSDCCVDVDCGCNILEFSFDRFSCAAEFIKLCLREGFVVEVQNEDE